MGGTELKIIYSSRRIRKTNHMIIKIIVFISTFLIVYACTFNVKLSEKNSIDYTSLPPLKPRYTKSVKELIDLNLNQSSASDKIILEQYKSIYESNKDLIGWIHIDGTNIDYPVMYTPDEPEFYLRRNFNKQYSFSGTVFVDGRSSFEPLSDNIILYGHNMKNETMFSELVNYKNLEFYKKHNIICFDTIYEEHEYEIISVFYSQVYLKSSDVFKYYNFINSSSKSEYDEYIENIKSLSIHPIENTATYPDKLLTLSTCSYHMENGRFVVVAKRIN